MNRSTLLAGLSDNGPGGAEHSTCYLGADILHLGAITFLEAVQWPRMSPTNAGRALLSACVIVGLQLSMLLPVSRCCKCSFSASCTLRLSALTGIPYMNRVQGLLLTGCPSCEIGCVEEVLLCRVRPSLATIGHNSRLARK